MGIFRITDPVGLDIVSHCRHPEMFHPHERSDELCNDFFNLDEIVPAGITLTQDKLIVVDLRQ
jgi:hypothetical protein